MTPRESWPDRTSASGAWSVQIRSSAPVTSGAAAPTNWQLAIDYRLPASRQLSSYAVCVQPD